MSELPWAYVPLEAGAQALTLDDLLDLWKVALGSRLSPADLGLVIAELHAVGVSSAAFHHGIDDRRRPEVCLHPAVSPVWEGDGELGGVEFRCVVCLACREELTGPGWAVAYAPFRPEARKP